MATTTNVNDSEQIILGSGDLYVVEYTGEIPEDATIETEENQAGNIKGGATLEYSSTSQNVKDDMGRVKKTVITEEDVKMKTGLITWAENWIKLLISTARIDTTTKPGHKVTKIGGLKNRHKKNYLLRFVHTKDNGRKIRVTITGKNTGTVSFAFTTDNPQQVDAEITAETLDQDGTLVIFDEELPAEPTQAAEPTQESGK